MVQRILRIGIYGDALNEIANRPFIGAQSFSEELGGVILRDFTSSAGADSVCGTRPPWQGEVDGVIVCMGKDEGRTSKDMADWVISGGAPAVAVGGDWIDPRIPTVRVNSRSLADLASEHLSECGCKSFLFVGYVDSSGSREREAAFRESLAELGKKATSYDSKHTFSVATTRRRRKKDDDELSELIQRLKKPLGVWTLNDHFAAGICELCDRSELNVPGDVKVLGSGDEQLSRRNRPTLSTIHTPGEQVGRLAMRTIHRILTRRGASRGTILVPAVELIERESTTERTAVRADMDEAIEYIARHACAGLTVEQLAERLDISRRSFEMNFKQRVGRSPREEIQRVRLARAEHLLRQTGLSISRIASMVGFAETAGFSKFFRKETGVSPRDFRAATETATH